MNNTKVIFLSGLFFLMLGQSFAQVKRVTLTKEKVLESLNALKNETKVLVMTSIEPGPGKSIPNTLSIKSGNLPKPPILAIVVCSGGGIKFATCVRDWLIAHPGKCLVVSESGGTYLANDDCKQ